MIKAFNPIRFALCMMIFAHHAYGYAGAGSAAVAAFFMLSGFCMTFGYKECIVSGNFDYFSFFKKRLCKIYIIHWITLFAWIMVFAVAIRGHFPFNPTVLTDALLLQSWIPERSVYFSYNPIAWYLSSTLFAYFCFPMLISFFHKLTRAQRNLVLVGILFAYGVVALAMPHTHYHAMLYINPCARLIDFVIGMFLANFYTNHDWSKVARYKYWIDFGIIVSFIVLNIVGIYVSGEYRLISAVYWLPALALILLTGISEKIHSPLSVGMSVVLVQVCTKCSFSMMMWSIFVIRLADELGVANGIWGGAITFFGAYVVAQGSFYFIENKLTTWIISKVN